jgi:DNA-binding beta-propeller fold protein YncE
MGTFTNPLRLKFDRLGSLYVLGAEGHRIHRCDAAAGLEVARWGGVKLKDATAIAAGPSGDLAVMLPGNYVVANLDRRGWVKGLCGSEGMEAGKLKKPVGVAVDKDGNIAVLDAKQSDIQLFSARGEPLRVIGHGGDGPGDIQSPIKLAIDPTRRFVAVLGDRDDHEVQIFDLQAKPGEELKGSFPGNEDALKKSRCVALANGLCHVAMKGGNMQSFNMKSIFEARGPVIEASGANGLAAGGSWSIGDGIETPTTMHVSNLGYLFTASPDDGLVQVKDMTRQGAVVTKIADANIVKKPTVATVDDFDRVYIWDDSQSRAVEFGR